jgi:hypothetical protein
VRSAIDRIHDTVVDKVLVFTPGQDLIWDAIHVGEILGVTAIALAVFGTAHFAVDWWLDRSDRDFSLNASAQKVNGMPSIERPSINVEGPR